MYFENKNYLCELIISLDVMIGSQNNDLIFQLYSDKRTVFSLPDIAILIGETNYNALVQRLFYYVKTKKILRPRKGIYTKINFNPLELSNVLYTPSYISLEYVLQKAGIIFQYNTAITAVSYLSRTLDIGDNSYVYRKIKNDVLIMIKGIEQVDNVNIATPERALLDTVYLNGETYFDNLNSIKKELVEELLPMYQSRVMEKRIKKIVGL